MNASFFIARRYLFSKKTHNVINIISGISVFGIAVSTIALVIVLSAFNGLEQLVISFNSAYEQDIRIESARTRTFDQSYVPAEVYQVSGLVNYTPVIEETIIIKNDEQFIIGKLKGIEEVFVQMSEMESHMEYGYPVIEDELGPLGVIGMAAFINLDGSSFGFKRREFQNFTIYAPTKNEKIKSASAEGFNTAKIPISGVFAFNNRVDEQVLVVPIDFAESILEYGNEISAIELSFEPGTDLEAKKKEIEALVGPGFKVETHLEQNQVIYQTSKTEKLITVLFLSFIFFMVTFTLVASITMLVLEKKANLLTLRALGADTRHLIRIFFYEGLLINFFGLVIGLAIGYGVCFLQQQTGMIMLDKDFAEPFPIYFKLTDLFLILSITVVLGTLVSYLPSRFLIKRIIK